MVLAGQVERARDAAQRAVDGRRAVGERPGAVRRDYRRWRWWRSPTGSSTGPCPSPSGRSPSPERNEAAWANPPPVARDRSGRRRPSRRGRRGVAGRPRPKPSRPAALARLPLYHWAIADVRLAAGDWDDAVTEAQAGLALIEESATEVGDVFANAICATSRSTEASWRQAQGGGRRGPTQSGGRPARDRLRVDDLDRGVAGRGGGPLR